jgi:hypothetical protein
MIELRVGSDWAELLVDGVPFHAGHSIPESVFVKLLQKLGHEVSNPNGNFCQMCSRWIPELQGEQCVPCTMSAIHAAD